MIVVGAGAAGLMAAIGATEMGAEVTIIEKNGSAGKKMLITGKGRCNITNTASLQDFIKAFPGNGQFLYGCLSRFSNQDMVDYLNGLGLETKVERGGRVFPASDKSSDVVNTMVNYAVQLGIKFYFNSAVQSIQIRDGRAVGVTLQDKQKLDADAVIITTGGASYPGTGSTGDGYQMAKSVGHTITPLKPSLVPLETAEEWVKDLQGLALKNVLASAWVNDHKFDEEFGEMLFTHFGVSGPIVLTMSRSISEKLDQGQSVKFVINLKPALTEEQLDDRLQRDFQKFVRKHFMNSLHELLPKSLIPVIIQLSGIPQDKPVHQITKEERLALVNLIQNFTCTVTKARPLREAIVTAGGVSVKEVSPKTMESKLIQGLYFAGEVLDVDGITGGYNLQAAFSTGYIAGQSAATQY